MLNKVKQHDGFDETALPPVVGMPRRSVRRIYPIQRINGLMPQTLNFLLIPNPKFLIKSTGQFFAHPVGSTS